MTGRITFGASLLSVTAFLCLGSLTCFSQNSSPSQGNPGQGTPSTGRTRQPGDVPQPGQVPDMTRPIYLSGLVRLPDGSIPPATAVIERVCGSTVRPEGYTDSNGRFSFI